MVITVRTVSKVPFEKAAPPRPSGVPAPLNAALQPNHILAPVMILL